MMNSRRSNFPSAFTSANVLCTDRRHYLLLIYKQISNNVKKTGNNNHVLQHNHTHSRPITRDWDRATKHENTDTYHIWPRTSASTSPMKYSENTQTDTLTISDLGRPSVALTSSRNVSLVHLRTQNKQNISRMRRINSWVLLCPILTIFGMWGGPRTCF